MAAVHPRAGRLTALAARGPVILASASPRRSDLLSAEGLSFRVLPSDVDETPLAGEPAARLCERLAREKALNVAARCDAGIVLAGDTIVVRDGQVLGKPAHAADARQMLASLSGREHEVLSSVALAAAGGAVLASGVACSRVAFLLLSDGDLDDYLASGEWEGKAGAYAIQGLAARFARLVSGDQDTVVGLPVALLARLADGLGSESPS